MIYRLTTIVVILCLSTTGCKPDPASQLRALSDNFSNGAVKYFPQLAPQVAAKEMFIPDASWRKAAVSWATQMVADAANIDAQKLSKQQQTTLAECSASAKEAAKLAANLAQNAETYNLAIWLHSIALAEDGDKRIADALQLAPSYYLAAADALTSLDQTTVAKAVAAHQDLIALLDRHPNANTAQARLVAKNYLAWCISKRSLALLKTKPAQ